MSPLARLADLLKPHRGKFALALACMAAACFGGLALPVLIKNLAGTAIATGRMAITPRLCLLLLGVVAVSSLAGGASFLLIFEIAHQVTARLRSLYVDRLLGAPMEFHRKERIGDLIDRLTTSMVDIEWFIKSSLGSLFGVVIVLAGSAVMMLILNWKLALLVALTVPATSLALRALYHRAEERFNEGRAALGSLISHFHALLLGIEIVKAFNAEQREMDRFQARQNWLLAVQRRTANVIALVEPIIATASVITAMIFLLYGGSLLASGQLPPEKLLAFLLYLVIVMTQARTLSQQMARWQQVSVALERIGTMLTTPREEDPPEADPLPAPVRGEIEFRDVVYWYSERDRAMDDLSFRIAPGECVGIVGESGAGKTTLFNLLLRFYTPQEGSIRIDGVDIQRATASSLRAATAFVPQDIVLFDDTVLENVRYGRPSADDQEVRAACRAAQAEGFILALPKGYETALGDRGMNLSGGQRQRLAIARALLKNAPILLLDEATSSLDAQTERQLREAMGAAMRGRTTIVIAHRLATVVHLPRIMVLSNGRMLDDGSHEELLRRCPTYRAFVATQLIPMQNGEPLEPRYATK